MKQRLKALAATVAHHGRILTEAQLAALERAARQEAHGEFEIECPGCCGAQDTLYVGTATGVGRICEQTFIDTSTKVGFAKLSTEKTPVTAADHSRTTTKSPDHRDLRAFNTTLLNDFYRVVFRKRLYAALAEEKQIAWRAARRPHQPRRRLPDQVRAFTFLSLPDLPDLPVKDYGMYATASISTRKPTPGSAAA